MKSTRELLAHFQSLDIKLWVENDKLRYDAPLGVLTTDLLAQLKEHKTDLIEWLECSEHDFPLSFSQERVWSYQKLHPTDCFYNVPHLFRLLGPLDVRALQESLDQLVKRHEILRTVLQEVKGTLRQRVMPNISVPWSMVNLCLLPQEKQSEEIHRLTQEEWGRPFNLSKDCLVRVILIQLEKQHHVLLICIHGIVVDNWSLGIFFRELGILYHALLAHQPSPLPPLPLQYKDYAQWQRQSLTSKELDMKLRYWKQWLAQEPPWLPLPTCQPLASTFKAGILWYRLPVELTKKLNQLSQQTGATLFMVILAVLGSLFYRYSGCQDVVIAVPSTDRHHLAFESLIGMIGSMLILRVGIEHQLHFLELLAKVRQEVIAALRYQDIPFEQIASSLQLTRQRPLFRVILSFLMESPRKQLNLAGLSVSLIEQEESLMRPDLGVVIWEEVTDQGTSLQGWWQYKKELFKTETIVQMMKNFENLLALIVANPEHPIDHLPLHDVA